MTSRYFYSFPSVPYGAANVVNITERVIMLDDVLKNPYVMHPYTINNGERPDQFAERYYGDPYFSWLLYLANQVVDPYYEWPLEQDEFNDFLTYKYGSVPEAQQSIAFWRNNWYDNMEPISVSAFDDLPATLQGYYQPYFGGTSTSVPTSYFRTPADWTHSTNKVVQYAVSNLVGKFVNDEVVRIKLTVGTSGTGQVAWSNGSVLNVQHVVGTTQSSNVVVLTSSSSVVGATSGATANVTSTSLLLENFTPAEEVYWSPVYRYDVEDEKNSRNRSIQVLDVEFAGQAFEGLKNLLNH